MDFSQNSGPLMTPPISPAMVNRGSVINQVPMAVIPQSACTTIQPHISCQAFPDPMFQSLPPSSPSYYPTTSNYQAVFRPQTHAQAPAYHTHSDSSHYPSFSEQHLAKDYFNSSCAVSPYSSRHTSNYSTAPDPGMETQGVELLDSVGYNFDGSGLNSSGCQESAYSTAGQSGKDELY